MTPQKILVWSALSSLLLLPTTAAAQHADDTAIRPYVTFTTGLAFTPDLESDTLSPLPASLFTEAGPNLTIGGGIGALYGYVRHELRADYHRAKVSGITPLLEIAGVAIGDPSGETLGVTTILYTIALRKTFLDDKLAVYGGIGVGAAYGVIPTGGPKIKDWEFGYSFSGGVFHAIWRGIGLDLGYRYVRATDFSTTLVSSPSAIFSDGEFPYSVAWSTHEVILSVRYEWGGGD